MATTPEEPFIGLLETVWSSIDSLCSGLGDDEWDRPTDCPGWTVRDQVAHMLGTEGMLAGRAAPESERDAASLPHVRNPIGAANETWVEGWRDRPGPEVLAAFREITAVRLAALRAMTPEEWDAEGFTPEGPGPYRGFMEIRVFDCWFHEQDIREALGVPGGLTGPVADLALGRVPKALPYVVGKKAGAPDGSTVVFEVEGTVHAVGVDGRAALLAEVPAAPTVCLTLDRRTFGRLAGGRWSGDRARTEGSVQIEGDADLAHRILDNFGYTI
jgi:uncharacterized protein (TIGR03083 family)